MTKKVLKEKLILFIIASFILFIIFYPFLWNFFISFITKNPLDLSQLFIIKDDWITQGIPFNSQFYQSIQSGSLGWNWNLFLGANFSVTKTGLILFGDIFAVLGFFINKIINYVPTTLFLILIIKLLFTCLSFDFYLSKFNFSFKTRIVFSLCYMLSGWSLIFMEQPLFLSFYAMIPLVLAGIENLLQGKKGTLFLISAFFALITSYYLSWSLCVYLLLYWTFRYLMLYKFNLKHFVLKSCKPLGTFLISVLLSSFIWLPALLFLSKSSRILSTGLNTISYWSFDNIISLLLNFLIPVTKFNMTLYNDPWYYFYQIGIYSSLLTILLVPQYFVIEKNIRKRNYMFLFLAIILITLLSPKIGFIFQFTYSLRYTYIISITLLLIAAHSFENLTLIKSSLLWISEFIVLILLFILGYYIPLQRGLDLSLYKEVIMISIIFIISIAYSLVLWMKKIKFQAYIIILILIGELILNSRFVILSQTENSISNADYLTNDLEVNQVFKLLKDYDPSFYRINLDVNPNISESMTHNFGLYYNIPSLSIYDSQYNYDLYDFFHFMRLYPDTNWIFSIREPSIFELLLTKYSIVSKHSDLDYYRYIGEEVPLLNNDTEFLIFKNHGIYSFAQTMNDFFPEDKLKEMSLNDDNIYLYEIATILNNSVVINQEKYDFYKSQYSTIDKQYFNPTYFTDNKISFNITLEEDSYLRFSMPASNGWRLTDNGKKIKFESISGGFIGLQLEKGVHQLHFTYKTPGQFLGYILSIIGLILICILGISKSRKHNK